MKFVTFIRYVFFSYHLCSQVLVSSFDEFKWCCMVISKFQIILIWCSSSCQRLIEIRKSIEKLGADLIATPTPLPPGFFPNLAQRCSNKNYNVMEYGSAFYILWSSDWSSGPSVLEQFVLSFLFYFTLYFDFIFLFFSVYIIFVCNSCRQKGVIPGAPEIFPGRRHRR